MEKSNLINVMLKWYTKSQKNLNVSMELLVENSIIENQKILSYEYGLPSYLQKDFD